jgi:hypothetical protein
LQVADVVPYQGTNVLVRFLAYSNATYTVQYRNNLSDGSDWQRLVNVPDAPFTRMIEATDTNAWKKTNRFYRVRAPATN